MSNIQGTNLGPQGLVNVHLEHLKERFPHNSVATPTKSGPMYDEKGRLISRMQRTWFAQSTAPKK